MKFIYLCIVSFFLLSSTSSMTKKEKLGLRETVKDMFLHAYDSYLTYAYPADELMPLSCKGRYRDREPSRGDVDDILGNFSMTLIDSLDSLAIFGEIEKFEHGVKLVIDNVQFDSDVVVSTFETNIRVLGGLLGAHVAADAFKKAGTAMSWYNDELLVLATDIGERLLPAFNTTTGIPYPKVNLKYGVADPRSRTGTESDTCTACAGTMIMEFGALSRLTNDARFEAVAHKAMMALWTYRSRTSDLVGTVINIHNGEWVRRDSGVGAGIDSYYEYCLKAYILLGEEDYLQRFNQHYKAVMRYINKGSLFVNVHMHNPSRPSFSYMDSLQAFWPGLQVLKGDLKAAIELHEVFYSVAKRHTFLPEAFTTNFEVHWGQHLLRPELVESTYFLHEATKDPYYLEVGKYIVENLNRYTRVPCGFAAVKDVRTLSHEDRMDSFLLSETLKYLYLLFTEKSDLVIDIHDFVFTTEAHILPLALSNWNGTSNQNNVMQSEHLHDHSCPSTSKDGNMMSFAEEIRRKSRSKQPGNCPRQEQEAASFVNKNSPPLLRAEQFIPGNTEHLRILKSMGISVTKTNDGKVQLMQNAAVADTTEMAAEGIKFMQSMIELAKFRSEDGGVENLPRVVQILSPPYNGNIVLNAGPAQFGIDLGKSGMGVSAEVVLADPFKGCTALNNRDTADHRIVVMERGECMFIDKVRQAESCGAVGAIIIDNNEDSSSESQPMFAMSGDGTTSGINIPAVFLFSAEGNVLQKAIQIISRNTGGHLRVRLADKATKRDTKTEESTSMQADQSTSSSGTVKEGREVPEDTEDVTTPERPVASGKPGMSDDTLSTLNNVDKLLKLMQNVANQPGFQYMTDDKKIKSKMSMLGKSSIKRSQGSLGDIISGFSDEEGLKDFLLKQKAAEKADLDALNENRHLKVTVRREPLDDDASVRNLAVGTTSRTSKNFEYASSKKDSTGKSICVIAEVKDETSADRGEVFDVISTDENAESVSNDGTTEEIRETVVQKSGEAVGERSGDVPSDGAGLQIGAEVTGSDVERVIEEAEIAFNKKTDDKEIDRDANGERILERSSEVQQETGMAVTPDTDEEANGSSFEDNIENENSSPTGEEQLNTKNAAGTQNSGSHVSSAIQDSSASDDQRLDNEIGTPEKFDNGKNGERTQHDTGEYLENREGSKSREMTLNEPQGEEAIVNDSKPQKDNPGSEQPQKSPEEELTSSGEL